MLYVNLGEPLVRTWHVGKPSPVNYKEIPKVVEVQADGDELTFILNRFINLPATTSPVQRWFGDHAKMIASLVYSSSGE